MLIRQPILFWHDVLGDPKILNDERYKKVIEQFKRGEYAAAGLDLKINDNNPEKVYSLWVNREDRLLGTTIEIDGKPYFYILEEVFNHDYDNAKSLKPNGVKKILHSVDAEQFVNQYFTELNQETLKDEADTPQKKYYQINYAPIEFINNHFVHLTEKQLSAINLNTPLSISGCPGSGKTLLAISLIEKGLLEGYGDDTSPILYVTKSPILLDKTNSMYEDSLVVRALRGDENKKLNVRFVTPEQLVAEIYSDKSTVSTNEVTAWIDSEIASFITKQKSEAKQTYSGANKKTKRIKTSNKEIKHLFSSADYAFNSASIYEELRIISGYYPNHLHDYLGLGRRQSSFHEKVQKEWMWDLYKRYLEHLDEFNAIHAPFTSIPADHLKYSKIILDEMQDLSLLELENFLHLAEKLNIVFLGDTNQSLFDQRSKLHFIRNKIEAMTNGAMTLTEHELSYSFRCSDAVTKAANKILQLKNIFAGGITKEDEYTRMEGLEDSEVKGKVEWLNSDEKLEKLKGHISNSEDYAVVTLAEFKDQAREEFPEGTLIFTPDEIKGLEFKNIVAYKLFDGSDTAKFLAEVNAKIKEATKDKIIDQFTINKNKADRDVTIHPIFNLIYTVFTRAIENLIVYQDERDNIANLINFIKLEFNVDTKIDDNILNEDPKKAILLFRAFIINGNHEQAEIIFKKISKKWPDISYKELADHIISPKFSIDEWILQHKPIEVKPIVTEKMIIPPVSTPAVSCKPTIKEIRQEQKIKGNKKPIVINAKSTLKEETKPILNVKTDVKIDSQKKPIFNNPIITVTDVSNSSRNEKEIIYIKGLLKNFIKPNILSLLKNAKVARYLFQIELEPDSEDIKAKSYLIDQISHDPKKLNLFIECLSDKQNYPQANDHEFLYLAILNGSTQIVKTLLEKGVDPNTILKNNLSLLHHALPKGKVSQHHIEIFKLLLAKMKVSTQSDLLNIAVENGYTEIVEALLLDKRINVHQEIKSSTYLHIAATHGYSEVINILLKDGQIDPNKTNNIGLTALIKAAISGHAACVSSLLQATDPNLPEKNELSTPLILAARKGNSEVVQAILNDKRTNPWYSNKNGEDALSAALKNNHHEVMRHFLTNKTNGLLVNFNKDIFYKVLANPLALKLLFLNIGACDEQHNKTLFSHIISDKNKFTMFMEFRKSNKQHDNELMWNAVKHGHLNFVITLLNEGINPNQIIYDNKNLLQLIIDQLAIAEDDEKLKTNYIEMFKLLMPKAAPLLESNKIKFMLIQQAVQSGNADIFQLLLNDDRFDEIVNSPNSEGYTLFQQAMFSQHFDKINDQLLNHKKINIYQPSNDGFSSLHIAARTRQTQIVKLFLDARQADPNDRKNTKQFTPLHEAIDGFNIECVELLLNDPRTDPNLLNARDFTPLHMAAENGHLNIFEKLISDHRVEKQTFKNNYTPLLSAISTINLNIEVVKYITENFNDYLNFSCTMTPKQFNALFEMHHLENKANLIKPHLRKQWTPLHLAIFLGKTDIVNHLLACNITLEQGNSGISPLQLAKLMQHQSIISILENKIKSSNNAPKSKTIRDENIKSIKNLQHHKMGLFNHKNDKVEEPPTKVKRTAPTKYIE